MLQIVKKVLRITVNDYDDEITQLISAAIADLELVGVLPGRVNDALVLRAIITYCRAFFGSPSDFERLKRCYDEQKAQLMMSHGYSSNLRNGGECCGTD